MNMVLRLFLNEFERTVYDGVHDGSYRLGYRPNTKRYTIKMPVADGEAAWWELSGIVMYPEFSFNKSIPVSKLFRYMIEKLHKQHIREAEAKRVKDIKDNALNVMKSKVNK